MSSMWNPTIGSGHTPSAVQKFPRLPYPSAEGAEKSKQVRETRRAERETEARRDRRRESAESTSTAQALKDQPRLAKAYGKRTSDSKEMVPTSSRVRSTDWRYYGYRPFHTAEGDEPGLLRVEDPGDRPSMARGGVAPQTPAALAGHQFAAIDPAPFDSAKHRANVAGTAEGESIPMPFETERIVKDPEPVAKKVKKQATKGGIRGSQHGLWTKTQEKIWNQKEERAKQAEEQKRMRTQGGGS